jgi:hypothetical protein
MLFSWAFLSRASRGALPGAKPLSSQGESEGTPVELSHLEHPELVPSADTIHGWIERIYAAGIRRPGYPADRRAEQLCLEHFRKLGLEKVRLEPLQLPRWEPHSWSLGVRAGDEELTLPCFPLPHAAPTLGLEGELVAFDRTAPDRVRGKVSLYDVTLQRLPAAFPVAGFPASAAADPELALRPRPGGRIHDPAATFENALQVLPFGPQIQEVMEPSIDAGAIAFIGVLNRYPGDSIDYYVPYDGKARPIPGVWIRGSDGPRLRRLLASGAVQVTLRVDSVRQSVTSHNVVAELPGQDDDLVVIGSHHDGPWPSAVEDASGVALVLAQASYWASVPPAERPHRLLFLVNAGHMVGGAGCRAFLERHAAELERIVLEVHLEHTAREIVEREGRLVPSGLPEPRWWFTSRIAPLEEAVWTAIQAEGLERSLVIPPDVFGPQPTTDGGAFHPQGVPLVNFLTAPFYLFDSMDTLDKIDRASLRPVTRAAIRIIRSTRDISAAAMRAAAADTA